MNRRQWETFYRWEWFRLEQWRHGFREERGGRWGGMPAALKRTLEDTGGKLALDAACGLGLRTIVMSEMGIDVVGSDGCAFAAEKARELSILEGHQIEFFTSRWSELPSRTKLQFDAIFNDGLTWIVTREEFERAIHGFLGALRPGGVLVFVGAPEGSTLSDSLNLLEEDWESKPRFKIQWTHSEGEVRCTSLLARDLRNDYIDEHHLFLIEEGREQRLETATIRHPVYWHWSLLQEMFLQAGFSSLETREFRGTGRDGTDFTLNLATK